MWPADLHLIAKEILRFHAIYWPAFLMAAGIELPKRVFAHGWLLFEESKMSKSKGNIVRPEPIRKVMGADALRYYLLREVVFGQDGNFSYDALVGRYNSDLANGLGNLTSRTLTMINQYCEGAIPGRDIEGAIPKAGRRDHPIRHRSFEALEFSKALETIWALLSATDKFIVEQAPWRARQAARFARAARRDALHGGRGAPHRNRPARAGAARSHGQDLVAVGNDGAGRFRAPPGSGLGTVRGGAAGRRSHACVPAHRPEDRHPRDAPRSRNRRPRGQAALVGKAPAPAAVFCLRTRALLRACPRPRTRVQNLD